MRPLLVSLVLATACHGTPLHDAAPETAARPMPVQERAPTAVPPPEVRAPAAAPDALPRLTLPDVQTTPAELRADPPLESTQDDENAHLLARVEALERKVASMERGLRSAKVASEPASPGLYSTWTLVALSLLTLFAVAAALVAIARAHRASSELAHARTAFSR